MIPLSRRIIQFIFSVMIITFYCTASYGDGLEEMSRGHFVIYYKNRRAANNILWKAEAHYKRIVNHIGIQSFRPWEGRDKEKCSIYLYPTKQAYIAATGAPEWSAGIAHSDMARMSLYEGVKGVEFSTLPHELTHILLHELWGVKRIPTWLNEGMAQFEETDKDLIFRRKKSVKDIVRNAAYFELNDLFKMQGIPRGNVELFYSQSASIVDYMIKDNLRANFGRFLAMMKDGKAVNSALKEAFQWKYKNGAGDLEKKWADYIRKKY